MESKTPGCELLGSEKHLLEALPTDAVPGVSKLFERVQSLQTDKTKHDEESQKQRDEVTKLEKALHTMRGMLTGTSTRPLAPVITRDPIVSSAPTEKRDVDAAITGQYAASSRPAKRQALRSEQEDETEAKRDALDRSNVQSLTQSYKQGTMSWPEYWSYLEDAVHREQLQQAEAFQGSVAASADGVAKPSGGYNRDLDIVSRTYVSGTSPVPADAVQLCGPSLRHFNPEFFQQMQANLKDVHRMNDSDTALLESNFNGIKNSIWCDKF